MDHFAESISISPKLINLMTQTVDINSMLSEVASYIAEITPSEFCWVISDYHNWFRGKIGTNYQDFKQKTPALSLLESKEFFLQPKVKEFLNYSSQTTLELNLDQLANLTWSGYLWLEKINLENSYKILLVLGKRNSWQERELANFQAQLPQIRLILQHISLKQNIALKTNYQKLLNQLTAIISQSKSLATTLDSVLQQLNQTLQIDTSVIVKLKYKNLLESKEENKIAQGNVEVAQFCSSKVLKLQNLANFSLSSSGLLQAGIKQAPQPLIVNNIESLDKDIQLEEIFLSASQAILLVPIMGHQTSQLVIGFLILQQQHPRVWQTEEIELLNWVGVQISNAILNSQTLSRVQSIVDERTAQLTWSLEMQGRLREKMLSQIEQLKSLNELKDDFLNSMSHELKTPLTTMKMAIEMLRQPDLSESLKEKYLDILEQEWQREFNLIKDLLTLQQIESAEFKVNLESVNLKALIEELSAEFRQKWTENKGLILKNTYKLEKLSINSDRDILKQILAELLLNAGKYAEPETTVTLEVDSQIKQTGTSVIIKVANLGTGITPAEMPYIFQKFRRGTGVTDRAVPGTGLGLSLVKNLVEHIEGEISATSEPIAKNSSYLTCFTLLLPPTQPTPKQKLPSSK